MKKTVEMLRELQYQRLSTTPEVRAMQRLANLPGIDISSSVDFANGLCQQKLTQVLCTCCGRLCFWVERIHKICVDCNRLRRKAFIG